MKKLGQKQIETEITGDTSHHLTSLAENKFITERELSPVYHVGEPGLSKAMPDITC